MKGAQSATDEAKLSFHISYRDHQLSRSHDGARISVEYREVGRGRDRKVICHKDMMPPTWRHERAESDSGDDLYPSQSRVMRRLKVAGIAMLAAATKE